MLTHVGLSRMTGPPTISCSLFTVSPPSIFVGGLCRISLIGCKTFSSLPHPSTFIIPPRIFFVEIIIDFPFKLLFLLFSNAWSVSNLYALMSIITNLSYVEISN